MGKLALRGMFLLAALIASMGLAMGLGSVSIPPDTILQEIVALLLGNPLDASTSMIIFDIRAPRILFAAMGGALLSLTGLLMQTVSQNYLADPYILGVSSGASTGAVLCLVTGAAQLFVTMLFIWLMRHELDLILLGRNEAKHLGMPVQQVQQVIVLVSSLAVAVVVALSGIIGFVGLVVPHIARSLGESRHAVMLWFTSLVGALVMVWADAAARTRFRPEELPIGILTATLGAPVFMWIISRKYKDY